MSRNPNNETKLFGDIEKRINRNRPIFKNKQ